MQILCLKPSLWRAISTGRSNAVAPPPLVQLTSMLVSRPRLVGSEAAAVQLMYSRRRPVSCPTTAGSSVTPPLSAMRRALRWLVRSPPRAAASSAATTRRTAALPGAALTSQYARRSNNSGSRRLPSWQPSQFLLSQPLQGLSGAMHVTRVTTESNAARQSRHTGRTWAFKQARARLGGHKPGVKVVHGGPDGKGSQQMRRTGHVARGAGLCCKWRLHRKGRP
jgi:hypothetical protein